MKYTTIDGIELELKPVSLLETEKVKEGILAEYRKRGEPVDLPTYKVKTVGGGATEKPLSPSNLTVEDNQEETERRQKAWVEHLDALERMSIECGNVITDIFLDGILCSEVPEAWIEKKRKRHIIIPEDKDELILLYKRLELVKSIEDVYRIRDAVIVLSLPKVPDVSAVGAAESMFQSQV